MENTSPMKEWLRSPGFWGGVICCFVTLVFAREVMIQTGGLFVYPLDDSYIHLALARTLSTYHVWGIGPSEFGSASSSPGWTLLLAGTNVLFSDHLLTPIVLNLLLAVCLLLLADDALIMFLPAVSLRFRSALTLILVFATPLCSLIFIGMEHVAQTLSVMLVAIFALKILTVQPSLQVKPQNAVLLMVSAGFAGAIRYEAAFVVFPVILLLLLRRRFLVAAMVALCSATGPVAFGLYSHHISGFWLPFSVLSKMGFGPHSFPVRDKLRLLFTMGGIPVLLPLLILWTLRFRRQGFWDPLAQFLLITSVVSSSHILFAPTMVGLMRYESYFVFLSIFAIATALASMWPATWVWSELRGTSALNIGSQVLLTLALLVLGISLGKRLIKGFVRPVQASVDRYHEHLPMANFVHNYYNNESVVVNDIGAVAYYTGAHLLDMAGLGSDETLLQERRGQEFREKQMAEWADAKHAVIAILQPEWSIVRQRTPSAWVLVQTWRIPRNVAFNDRDISFYAITSLEVPRLCGNLTKVSPPAGDQITFNRCDTSNDH